MNECPFCDHKVERTGDSYVDAQAEVRHMREAHPDIVVGRLRAAGMHIEADEFERERANEPKDYAGIFEDVAGVLDRREPDEMTMMAEAMRIHARQEREARAL